VRGQIITSLLVSFPIVVAAYFIAAHAEHIFQTPHALNASGMIAAFLAAAVPLAHIVHRVVLRGNSDNVRKRARDPQSYDLNRRPA